MSYLGNSPVLSQQEYRNIDDISGSFNGSTTSFALLVNGVAPVPAPQSSNQCLISVNGVIQKPDDTGATGFRLSGGNIIFSAAPTGGQAFFGVILAGADYIYAGQNYPDGTVSAPSITFAQDLDTGFYRSGAGEVKFTANGANTVTLSSNNLTAPSFIPTSSSAPTNGVYLPAANTVAIATNSTGKLFINSSGQVGIGTSSPGTNLDIVVGSGTATQKLGSSSVSGGSYLNLHGASASKTWFIGANYNFGGVLEFTQSTVNGGTTPSSTPAMVLSAAGNVGIGSNAPAEMLTVGTNSVGGNLRINSSSAGNNGLLRMYASDGVEKLQVYVTTTATTFYTPASIPLTFDVAGSERFRCDSSGRLLVGTTVTSLTSKINIKGRSDDANGNAGLALLRGSAVSAADQSLGGVFFLDANENYGASIYSQSEASWTSGSSHPARLVFTTTASGASSPTERVRITNDGKALFGGTTSTAAKWNFWDTDSTGMAWLSATSSGNYRRAYLYGSAGSQYLYFNNGFNEAYLTNTGAWTNASDARIKKDIEPISYGLAEVMAAQPRKYKMIADDQKCIGFVAQEMREIIPEVVSGGQTEDRQYGLDYGSLVAVAFRAIQEQQAIIEGLEARLAALESA